MIYHNQTLFFDEVTIKKMIMMKKKFRKKKNLYYQPNHIKNKITFYDFAFFTLT